MDKRTYFILKEPWVVCGMILGKGAYGNVNQIRPLFDGPGSSCLPPVLAVKSSLETNSILEEEMLLMFKHHPNIIGCFGSEISYVPTNLGLKTPCYHIFLEYASNGCLTDEIKKTRGEGFSEKKVSEYLKGILLGLREIHKAGVIHCDIKPGNILIADGVPKIADFGLAIKSSDSRLEKRGTLEFMAPEIIADGIYTTAADIWSLGCTVLMMLNGKNVWGVPFTREMMRFVGDNDVIPTIPNELSEECRNFLHECFIRDFWRRGTAESLLNHPFLFREQEHINKINIKKPTYLETLTMQLNEYQILDEKLFNFKC